jgi:predicted patatin/cPLA2 family phospholipase
VLTRPREYRRSAGTLRSFLIGWTYPRFPGVRAAMAGHVRTANLTLDQIERLESAGALSVIRPDTVLAATRLSRSKRDIDATIATGVDAARQWLDRQTWW